MVVDDRTTNEYLLLKNYRENSLYARGLLLRMALVTLRQIESDIWPGRLYDRGELSPVIFSDVEKRKVKATIQIDIISKIMMYVEDLAILAESFRQGIVFYEFLDSKDPEQELGRTIEHFFGNIDSYTDADLMKIMSYIEPEQTGLDGECVELLKKHVKINIEEVRRVFKQIGEFGKTNHPVFKRFKHAGFPIVLDTVGTFGANASLAGFDSYMIVSKGIKPLQDVIPIPYSREVLEGYDIIIRGIQTILIDMVENRIASIQRGVKGIIVPESYAYPPLPHDKLKRITAKAEKYFSINPITQLRENFMFSTKITKEDVKWYLSLQEFLSSCRQRK